MQNLVYLFSVLKMEPEKLQRLHDTLSKLMPRGKIGGLGYDSFAKQIKKRNNDLPQNG